MEAVQIRQRGAEDFAAYYESLCALQDICPVASIRAGVKEGVLNCHVRRLKNDDWHPVLTALKINKVLHTIVFYEKWEERVLPAVKNLATDDALRKYCSKHPSRLTSSADKHTTFNITKTLQDCLLISSAVRSLVLEGIPLTYRDCKCLAKALLKNHSISHLSFKGSGIGDRATEVICDAVRDSCSLEWIDLTACDLTSQGTSAVANVIKHQCLQRQSAAWKDSLRFHQPPLGQMPGLRRVTLNLNTELGDKGARELADILRDDVCLKALDLQSCGVTTEAAKLFIEVLKFNSCLMVLDVRANALVDDDVIDVIHEQLMINVSGMDKSEESYIWLDVEVEKIFHEIKLTQAPAPAPATKKSKHQKTTKTTSKGQLQMRRSFGSYTAHRRGIPWRTAARSSQRWKIVSAPSLVVRPRSVSSEPVSNSSTPSNERAGLKAELSTCYRRLREEIRARAKAEAYITELLEQNRQLSEELKQMKEKSASSSDDQMLEAVEATFRQFSAFLDILRDKGLGELCALLPNSAKDMNTSGLDDS